MNKWSHSDIHSKQVHAGTPARNATKATNSKGTLTMDQAPTLLTLLGDVTGRIIVVTILDPKNILRDMEPRPIKGNQQHR